MDRIAAHGLTLGVSRRRTGLQAGIAAAENSGMSLPSFSPALIALSLVTALLPVALGLGLMRALRRRQRGDERTRTRRLALLMRRHVRRGTPGRVLAEAVSAATPAEFWSALEAGVPRLTRAERRRLGGLFERTDPVAAERHALLFESPLRRELAARRLGLLPCPRSRRALRSAIGASPELVGYAAARSLARDGDLRSLDWALSQPGLLPQRTARDWAVLLRAFGRGALPRLGDAVRAGIQDTRVLRAAVETLGLGRHAPAAAAIECLVRHADAEVRVAAVRALGRIATSPNSPVLLEALSDTAWPVRAQAAWALGRIGLEAAVPALSSCLTDREWWVRRHAAYALAGLGNRGADVLRVAAQGSPDRYARDIADEALRAVSRSA